MTTLNDYLQKNVEDDDLQTLLSSIAEAGKEIAAAVTGGNLGKAGTKNLFGEEQIALDVQAEQIMEQHLKSSGLVKTIASEELDGQMDGGGDRFAVVYDPLDGSSLIDVNLAVGTIVGIYEGGDLIGRTGRDQVAALFFVYGPRLTMMLTVKKGTVEFRFNEQGEFMMSNEKLLVAPEGKMFAPGNLKATKVSEGYNKLANYWMNEGYKLRYSGGMVPDINQILIKGKGIFTYPGSVKKPEGKLRLLFECNPMALILEEAGGYASDGVGAILDKEVTDHAQSTPILIGSRKEVEIAEKYLA